MWRGLEGDMIMCLSGIWTGVGEKDGWVYDYVFIWFWRGVGVEKVGREYDYVFIWFWTGVGVEKVGREYDCVFYLVLDRSWCGEGWEGI